MHNGTGSSVILDSSNGRQILSEPFILHHGVEGLGECFPGNDCCEKCRAGGLNLSGCAACLGAIQTSTVEPSAELDLTDPAVLREIRMAMAWAQITAYLFSTEPDVMAEFNTPAFLDDPVWGVASTKLAYIWIDQYELHRGPLAADEVFVAPNMYPTAKGVTVIMGELGYFTDSGSQLPQMFPRLSAFMEAVGPQHGEGGEVDPPFLSDAGKQEGGSGLQASTLAMAGIGAVGVAIFVLALRGK